MAWSLGSFGIGIRVRYQVGIFVVGASGIYISGKSSRLEHSTLGYCRKTISNCVFFPVLSLRSFVVNIAELFARTGWADMFEDCRLQDPGER